MHIVTNFLIAEAPWRATFWSVSMPETGYARKGNTNSAVCWHLVLHFKMYLYLPEYRFSSFCLYLLYLNNIDKRHWPLYKKIFFVRTPTPYLAAHVGLIVEFVEVDETSKDDAHILVILRIFGGFFQLVWHVLWYNVVKQPVSLKRKKIFVLLQSRIINTKINK